MKAKTLSLCVLACASWMAGCGGAAGAGSSDETLRATIGPQGGELVGVAGSALEGVRVQIPAGALATDTEISVRAADAATPLPATAIACGRTYAIEPAGLALAAPATITLPDDPSAVAQQDRFDDEVKAWVLEDGAWGQRVQTDSAPGSVTFEVDALGSVAPGVNPPANVVRFPLHVNPKFAACLAQYPNDARRQPVVNVEVERGEQNDGLFLRGSYIKPGLQFDLFTVQNSQLRADGTPDPAFTNFGLAWYQSDLEADGHGEVYAAIRTILLDQIFGFDPDVSLPPTNTFELGFWFNDPQAAVACGFDATKPTPFNGDHAAGPLAMISVPDAVTALGPLCTNPDTSVTPARCSP